MFPKENFPMKYFSNRKPSNDVIFFRLNAFRKYSFPLNIFQRNRNNVNGNEDYIFLNLNNVLKTISQNLILNAQRV